MLSCFLSKVAFEGHGISKLKESEQPSFLHLHNRKTKTFNHFEYFPADSTALCPQMTEIMGNNFFFFFCEDKHSLTDKKRLDFLMISISARFLSDATLAMARLLQDLLFKICNRKD